MSPIQQMFLGSGGAVATKPYVDDVFNTYVYEGDGTTNHQIVNGIDLATHGGLIWGKERGNSGSHYQFDTVRGLDKRLKSNSDNAEETDTFYSSVNSNGYTINKVTSVNVDGNDYVSWTFRKAPGFFDVVSYTGNGQNARTISHSLASIPGMVIVKARNDNEPFQVLHRSLGPTKYGVLNSTAQFYDNDARWNDTAPTSTNFTVGTDDATNKSGTNYIAYLFAGGESTASEAVSVNFDGSDDYLTVASSSDLTFGTGDFTIEFWVNPDDFGNRGTFYDSRGSNDTTGITIGHESSSGEVRVYINAADGGDITVRSSDFGSGQWQHIAVTRSSGTVRLFINGILKDSGTRTSDLNTTNTVRIGYKSYTSSSYSYFNGKISNFRIVKGTAVYTSTFRQLTAPLTNITNTKLLCCNNSSVTGKTVGPTITSSDSTDGPTASSDSSFDDPAGFVFGENEDQGIIKCGSYTTNSNEDAIIDLGWEPQWVLTKRIDANGEWRIFDSMRGLSDAQSVAANNATSMILEANDIAAEATSSKIGLSSTGLYADQDGASRTYIYVALRRPDAYVGKLPSLGTSVLTMTPGTSGAPLFLSPNHIVDFALQKSNYQSGTADWSAVSRITQGNRIETNTDIAELSNQYQVGDYSNGWGSYTLGDGTRFGWLFKRYAGLDVVTYKGDGVAGRQIPHSLNRTIEMIWIKNRSSANGWAVGHKGLNGGTNPWEYNLKLNETADEESYTNRWNDTAPTSTHFTIGTSNRVNEDGDSFIAFLFASVDKISKVGYYTGNGTSSNTITVGFQPRFVLIKSSSVDNTYWATFDTVRGWAAGNDQLLQMQSTGAQGAYDYLGAPTSTGFEIVVGSNNSFNANNENYVYYAHA